MKTCPYCGTQNLDGAHVCKSCGAFMNDNEKAARDSYSQPSYYSSNNRRSTPRKVPYYPNGGLIFWSIITSLLCTIFGVFALVNACCINNCVSASVQEHRISVSKTCNTIGTILGLFFLIIYIATGLYS